MFGLNYALSADASFGGFRKRSNGSPRVITTGANKQSETAPAAAWYLLCSLNNPYGQCKEATNICVVYAVSVILSICANNRSKRPRGICSLCDPYDQSEQSETAPTFVWYMMSV